MKESVQPDFIEQSCQILGDSWQPDRVTISRLTPDGSLRRFCRLQHRNGSRVVVIAPPAEESIGRREAEASWKIGRHLQACSAPVPDLYGFSGQNGLLVCEDLGDIRLHDLVMQHGCASEQVIALYQQAVRELARMQVRGREKFDCSWCWDTPCYDRSVMLERESGYFLQALCKDFLRLSFAEDEITQEFEDLADRALQADASFFLHRDFQSRNIMVHQGRVRFIDFQAGRLGPAAYDLASLLIDPYAALPEFLQKALFDEYLAELTTLVSYDPDRFRHEFILLAVQRNLQMLGAFAFLSGQRAKPFFYQYIQPSLQSLQTLLAKAAPDGYPCLKALTGQCLSVINQHSKHITS